MPLRPSGTELFEQCPTVEDQSWKISHICLGTTVPNASQEGGSTEWQQGLRTRAALADVLHDGLLEAAGRRREPHRP